MSQKARPLPLYPPTLPTSLASYVVSRMEPGGTGRPIFLYPTPTSSFLGSQSRRWRERHAEIKVSDENGAIDVKGKLREGSNA